MPDETRRIHRSGMSLDTPNNKARDAFVGAMLRVAEIIKDRDQ